MAAPVGSVTVPANWPYCTWANALNVSASTANTARQNCNLFIYLPPRKLCYLVFVVCTETVRKTLLLRLTYREPEPCHQIFLRLRALRAPYLPRSHRLGCAAFALPNHGARDFAP